MSTSTLLRGRFYFKRTRNKNLIGEFSNDQSADVFTESCDLQPSSDGIGSDDFDGTYFSTWRESTQSCFADLVIINRGNLFSLEWTGRAGTSNFEGRGMRCDDMLIGDYWQT